MVCDCCGSATERKAEKEIIVAFGRIVDKT
jgi:hypothetical protein